MENKADNHNAKDKKAAVVLSVVIVLFVGLNAVVLADLKNDLSTVRDEMVSVQESIDYLSESKKTTSEEEGLETVHNDNKERNKKDGSATEGDADQVIFEDRVGVDGEAFDLIEGSGQEGSVVLDMSEFPKIKYPAVIYPSEDAQPYSTAEKQRLESDIITPLIQTVNEGGTDYVLYVEVELPDPQGNIDINTVLMTGNGDSVGKDQIQVRETQDGSYELVPGPSPGYAG